MQDRCYTVSGRILTSFYFIPLESSPEEKEILKWSTELNCGKQTLAHWKRLECYIVSQEVCYVKLILEPSVLNQRTN